MISDKRYKFMQTYRIWILFAVSFLKAGRIVRNWGEARVKGKIETLCFGKLAKN